MDTLCKIREIYRITLEYEVRFEKAYNLSLNEGMLLCSLSQKDHLTSGEIAQLLGLTHSNTSKVIRSVEKKGLLRRLIGKKDKRQMHFSLTTEGRKRMETITCEKIEVPERLQSIINFQDSQDLET